MAQTKGAERYSWGIMEVFRGYSTLKVMYSKVGLRTIMIYIFSIVMVQVCIRSPLRHLITSF